MWISYSESGEILGMVMLAPHSKGGHLDNLAVYESARGLGIGIALVQQLLKDTAEMGPSTVTLTTRIPEFFSKIGFKIAGCLDDGSKLMFIIL